MANNPPTTETKKRAYRTLFAAFGIAVVATTLAQSLRTTAAEERARQVSIQTANQTHADELVSQSQLSYMQGKLDAISNFIGQYVTNPPSVKTGSYIDLSTALAILKMVQGGGQQSQVQVAPMTPQQTQSVAPPPSAVLSTVPKVFGSGELTGVSFGSHRGQVYIHARIKESKRSAERSWSPDSLTAGLLAGNYFAIDDSFIKNWSDTSIQLAIPANYVMDKIVAQAKRHNVAPPETSDVEVGYQVRRVNDPAGSNWLYSPLTP